MALIDRTGAVDLIPEEIVHEIIQSLPSASAAMRMFRTTRMSRKLQQQPVLASLPTAGFVTGDTGLIPTTMVSWTNRVLTAEELAVIVPVPKAVLDDADYDIFGEIKPRLIEAFGATLDGAVLHGIGKPASWPAAIEAAAAAAGNEYTAGSVGGQKLDVDLSKTMELVENDGFGVSGMVAGLNLRGGLRGLRDANGQPITGTNNNQSTIYEVPVRYVENGSFDQTKAMAFVGDLSQAVVATRDDFTFEILKEAVIQNPDGSIAYNLAQQNLIAIKCVGRFAYQTANPINRMNSNSATRSPFAVLRPVGYVG